VTLNKPERISLSMSIGAQPAVPAPAGVDGALLGLSETCSRFFGSVGRVALISEITRSNDSATCSTGGFVVEVVKLARFSATNIETAQLQLIIDFARSLIYSRFKIG
jgi:hypothetical protein